MSDSVSTRASDDGSTVKVSPVGRSSGVPVDDRIENAAIAAFGAGMVGNQVGIEAEWDALKRHTPEVCEGWRSVTRAVSEVVLAAARERITEMERGLDVIADHAERATEREVGRAKTQQGDMLWTVGKKARSLLASVESPTSQEAHEIEAVTRNSNNGMTFAAACSCGWESTESEENSFLAIERHGEPHLASVGQPREGDEPRCTCLPEPDGVNDCCPLHGEDRLCDCGHPLAEHGGIPYMGRSTPCASCSCIDFAAAALPVEGEAERVWTLLIGPAGIGVLPGEYPGYEGVERVVVVPKPAVERPVEGETRERLATWLGHLERETSLEHRDNDEQVPVEGRLLFSLQQAIEAVLAAPVEREHEVTPKDWEHVRLELIESEARLAFTRELGMDCGSWEAQNEAAREMRRESASSVVTRISDRFAALVAARGTSTDQPTGQEG